jgi:endo-1,4-beta-mannosidase
MRWWRDFDRAEVERDFSAIAAAGGDSVRIFLLWSDFQPVAGAVSEPALARLVEVADVASANGLALVPTLFTGHMSGANWIPSWALGANGQGRFPVITGDAAVERLPLNWYEDRVVRDAQELLARESAGALRGHPALWAWDLGNENSNVCVPATRDLARSWLGAMANAIRVADPAARITIGLHMEDLEDDRGLGPAEAAEVSDFLCMHGYPLYARWARGPADAALPAYLAEVTRWLGGKDVFFEEFGMPTRTPKEEQSADVYVAEALSGLHAAGSSGAMLWCFADYVPAIWSRPPLDRAAHERFFGVWRADGSPKPAARQLRRYAGVGRLASPRGAEWPDVARERFYDDPAANLRRMYARYVQETVAP